jgi:DNA-binding Xre family transcriptional regulator
MQVARVVSRVKFLLEEKEKREGRRISYRKVVEETGVSLTSIQNWIAGNATQYREEQILALCRYFNCEVGDLLQIDDND